MKISTATIDATRRQDERKAEDKKKSHSFSQVLNRKNEEGRPKSAGAKGGTDNDAELKSRQAFPDSRYVSPLALGDSPSHETSTTAEAAKTSRFLATPSAQVEQLTNEISHQIDVIKQGGKNEGVNITFDSKTLEGLQVQIRPQNGEMAIRFVTQSENVSNLLSKHTGELLEALKGKGVQIRNITISSHSTPMIWSNRRASA